MDCSESADARGRGLLAADLRHYRRDTRKWRIDSLLVETGEFHCCYHIQSKTSDVFEASVKHQLLIFSCLVYGRIYFSQPVSDPLDLDTTSYSVEGRSKLTEGHAT